MSQTGVDNGLCVSDHVAILKITPDSNLLKNEYLIAALVQSELVSISLTSAYTV